jgi:uncharacterized membrane protein YqaE (UPF0057 family)
MTPMHDIKNFFLALVSGFLPPVYAFLQQEPTPTVAKGALLTVLLFIAGKGIDLVFQHYWKRREERRNRRSKGKGIDN